jgi:hypothetical protein
MAAASRSTEAAEFLSKTGLIGTWIWSFWALNHAVMAFCALRKSGTTSTETEPTT